MWKTKNENKIIKGSNGLIIVVRFSVRNQKNVYVTGS
jgi:hypothetical protein